LLSKVADHQKMATEIATEIVVKNVNEIAIKIEEGIENEIRRMKNEESLHKKM
jgi:hypothetical protein